MGLVILDSIPPVPGAGDQLMANAVPIHYEVITSYVNFPGHLQIPVADDDDGADCEIAKTHAAMWQKWLDFTVRCVGATPVCPSWETDDDNLILLSASFGLGNPVPADSNNWSHCASGSYRFAMITPPDETQGFKTSYTVYFSGGRATYKTNFRKEVMDWQ